MAGQFERLVVHYDPPSFRFGLAPRFLVVPALFGRVTGRRAPAIIRTRFAVTAALLDICTIILTTVFVSTAYHGALYRDMSGADGALDGGALLGIVFAAANVLADEYDIARFQTFAGHVRRVFLLWNAVFAALLFAIFITKTTADFSRATILLAYAGGYATLLLTRRAVVGRVKRDEAIGQATAQRIFLVGDETEIDRFTARHEPWQAGLRIVASAVLRGPETLADDLALAAASARMLRPDDVFILIPWAQGETIDACVTAFMRVPAAIHLGPERVLDRFTDARISRIGTIASLNLVRHPLTPTEVVVKRGVDLVVATAMLVLLTPLFLAVAIAIKLDSRGPVLFLQRRYGFNQEPFRIVKFRSMTTMEEGRAVRQALKGDVRVTRVGRLIRRFNIDELPQLLNVLRGEMSLVGPRPHALAHDQLYDRTMADYARRHNVKPGITGWAQVNGLRGPILADSAMRRRVDHDLYYIDNWSMALDLRILVLTLLSGKAFENAL